MAGIENVSVFWDYENCRPPSGIGGNVLVNNIRTIAHRFGKVTSFKAYLDLAEPVPSKSPAIRSELQSCGISLVDCPHNGRKDVADKMMIVDMLAYAVDNPAPATVILISGDGDFAYAVSVLRLRMYRVIVITPRVTHASTSIKYLASLVLDWDRDVLATSASMSSVNWRSRASSDAQNTNGTCDETSPAAVQHLPKKDTRPESQSEGPRGTRGVCEVDADPLDTVTTENASRSADAQPERPLDGAPPDNMDNLRYSVFPWACCEKARQRHGLFSPSSPETSSDELTASNTQTTTSVTSISPSPVSPSSLPYLSSPSDVVPEPEPEFLPPSSKNETSCSLRADAEAFMPSFVNRPSSSVTTTDYQPNMCNETLPQTISSPARGDSWASSPAGGYSDWASSPDVNTTLMELFTPASIISQLPDDKMQSQTWAHPNRPSYTPLAHTTPPVVQNRNNASLVTATSHSSSILSPPAPTFPFHVSGKGPIASTSMAAISPSGSSYAAAAAPARVVTITTPKPVVTITTPKPKTVPPAFKPLVEFLRKARLSGEPTQIWSIVASGLKDRKAVYQKAGAANFKEFAQLAQKAGIVELGGDSGNNPWIRLRPAWHGKGRA